MGTMRWTLLVALASAPLFAAAKCDRTAVLRALAKSEAKGSQTFLLSKDERDGEQNVYWVEAHTLLLIGHPADNESCRSPSLLVRRRLQLAKDVVETEAKVGSSTYLVTRAWMADQLFALARDGEVLHVTP